MADAAPATASSDLDPARRRRRPRLGSLRARLIASHALVLLVAVALIAAIGAGLLRREEGRAQEERLRALAVPLMVEVGVLARRPSGSLPAGERLVAEALTRQAAATGVRLLVFDADGTVRLDTAPDGSAGGNLTGQALPAYAEAIAAVRRQAAGGGGIADRFARPAVGNADPLDGDRVVVAADGREPAVALALAAPAPRPPLVGRLLVRLLIVLAVALAVASIVGLALSRRIAAPVGRLTAAADAMAGGALSQRVVGEGSDEIGRLVASFNGMSRRVATTARSQRELLANVAHELRTPLTNVRGYAQALRDGVVTAPEERERALTTIGEEAERMGRLVGELLDLARLESGQAQLRPAPVELAPALARVAARFAPEAARRRIAITTGAPPGLRARADEERLARILDNLVGNALRHTLPGGAVALAAAPVTGSGEAGPAVRLTIRDSGVGIPAARLARIFERFERGDASGTGPEPGFGLGLAIVRELVAAHGGTIAVASEVGAGTTFTIDLPAAPADDDARDDFRGEEPPVMRGRGGPRRSTNSQRSRQR